MNVSRLMNGSYNFALGANGIITGNNVGMQLCDGAQLTVGGQYNEETGELDTSVKKAVFALDPNKAHFLDFGYNYDNREGGGFFVRSVNYSTPGAVGMYARNATGSYTFECKADGFATWAGKLHLTSTADVQGTTTAEGALIIGPTSGAHLGFDNNELMAKASANTCGTLYINSNGGLVEIGSGGLTVTGTLKGATVQSTSDARLKRDFEPIDVDISAWAPYKYTLLSDGKRHVGLIAQEVQVTLPEAVTENKEENKDGSVREYLTLDYNAIVAVLVGKVNALEKRLSDLEVN